MTPAEVIEHHLRALEALHPLATLKGDAARASTRAIRDALQQLADATESD